MIDTGSCIFIFYTFLRRFYHVYNTIIIIIIIKGCIQNDNVFLYSKLPLSLLVFCHSHIISKCFLSCFPSFQKCLVMKWMRVIDIHVCTAKLMFRKNFSRPRQCRQGHYERKCRIFLGCYRL